MVAERTSPTQLSFKREFAKTIGPISLITEVEKTTTVDKKIIEIDLDKNK
ncbi:MAG TPA: hypothetical protein GX497_04855 [Bacillus bacterium]|nr:hypothetical protein [Bacillus sp. (in: firmicutes)]